MYNSESVEDAELINRIKRDESRALRILFEKYFAALCRFAFTFVKSPELAEEVVSDVFARIWLKRKKIEIKSNPKMYLYTAVRNQSLNYMKSNAKTPVELHNNIDKEKISDLNADRGINYEEFAGEIDSLLNRLPKKRQIIFKMNRLDGLSYKEISEILSISVRTVQNQMVEAVKFLSNCHPRRK